MPPRKELRDFRSLERRSMYSIFHALDPNERLPRELISERGWFGWPDVPHVSWLVGVLYLPVLILTVVVLVTLNVNALLAFAIAGVALIGVYAFLLVARRR